MALAGPRWFQPEKDGIAFWLATRAGRLVHVSGGTERPLFAVEAFVWYAVDVVYDVAGGRYDLAIRREGEEVAQVALRGQANVAGRPGSVVDKFSFVGSPYADTSSVDYFVDDVVRSDGRRADAAPSSPRDVARSSSTGSWRTGRGCSRGGACRRRAGPEELGLAAAMREGGGSAARRRGVRRVLRLERGVPGARSGRRRLRPGPLFERAAASMPEAWIYRLSSVLALSGLKRFADADLRLASLLDVAGDPRVRGRLRVRRARDAATWRARRPSCRGPACAGVRRGALGAAAARAVLLRAAVAGAVRGGARLRAARARERAPLDWTERAADASFHLRDLAAARALYERAIADEKDHGALMVLYLKLADVAYLAGDAATERRFREHYYGALVE